jgi:DNA ligase-1
MRGLLPQQQEQRGLYKALDPGMNPPATGVESTGPGATGALSRHLVATGKKHMQENSSKRGCLATIHRVLLNDLVEVSAAVAGTRARLRKIEALAGVLERLEPTEIPIAVAYLSGDLPHPPIGIGWAALRDRPPEEATKPSLTVLDVDTSLRKIGATTGKGSQAERKAELAGLFGRATGPEQQFLTRLLTGELRQGALQAVMADSIAEAADVPAPTVRRSLMLAGDLGTVAIAALTSGSEGLAAFRLTLLQPIQPMLAQPATDLASALERFGEAAVEWKLDGARLQVHVQGDDVRAFTRNLADVTDRVPEVVEALQALSLDSAILDGEVIALDERGRPHPFQVTMSRFGSRRGVEALRDSGPLSPFFFDCLHLDGQDVLDLPARQRFAALAEPLPEELLVPRIETGDAKEAERFLADVLERGHEGVMVKALDAPYEAGRRGGGWLKVKPSHTLDLVVLAAEWGHGRRQGWLSNIHLGARDADTGGFVMLGKTFKGMTDEMLGWQTEKLLELETTRDGHVVHVRPELVVEVAFDGLQQSSRYPGGLALRFARVKGYRPDKSAAEADTIQTVRRLHSG